MRDNDEVNRHGDRWLKASNGRLSCGVDPLIRVRSSQPKRQGSVLFMVFNVTSPKASDDHLSFREALMKVKS